MKILLITQYSNDILNNTIPSDAILIKHFNLYHKKIVECLTRKGHDLIIKSGLEQNIEYFVISADVVFCIRSDFGYPNGELSICLLCEKHNIPYVGTNSSSKFYDSDKVVGKLLAKELNIPTPQYFLPYQIENVNLKHNRYLLKPRFGSSSRKLTDWNICSSLNDIKNKMNSIKDIQNYFIEQFIDGKLLTVGCFLDETGCVRVSHPYFLISKNNFVVTFEDKKSGNVIKVPINNKRLCVKVKAMAKKYFLHIQPCLIARLDFMIRNHHIYFIEINTTPTLSPSNGFISYLLQDNSYSYDDFIDYLLMCAISSNK